MTRSPSPDLALPGKSPTESYQDESHNSDQFAVYTLVNLQHDGFNHFLKVLENDDDLLKGNCRLPPQYDFSGRPLKDVYNYHLQLRSQRKYHPTLFLVAPHLDYKANGVLLVNLNTDLHCTVDTCRLRVTEALSAAVNLRIGNMDWDDFKEDELLVLTSGGGDQKSYSTTPQAWPHASEQSASSLFIFGAYGIAAGANMTTIRDLLESDWRDKDPKAWICESIGSYTDYHQPLDEVIKRHPWNCRRNPRLHRQWCICIDGRDPAAEGVLLTHIDWDGNISREPNELLRLHGSVTTERAPVDSAIALLMTRISGERDSH